MLVKTSYISDENLYIIVAAYLGRLLDHISLRTEILKIYPSLASVDLTKSRLEVVKEIHQEIFPIIEQVMEQARSLAEEKPEALNVLDDLYAVFLTKTKELSDRIKTEGPRLWRSLHAFAFNWNGNEEEARRFLLDFSNNIPCGDCRKHWLEFLEQYPIDLSSTEAFFNWTVKLHNVVNARLEKKQYSLEQAIADQLKDKASNPFP